MRNGASQGNWRVMLVAGTLRTVESASQLWGRTPVKVRIGVGAAAVVCLTMLGYLAVNSDGPAPRARQYLAFKACLLTDSQGIAGKGAATAWAGMQQASLSTRAKIQYLPVAGPATVPTALPYLRSLVQLHCDLIVAASGFPSTAVAEGANHFEKNRFVVIGERSTGPNIVSISADTTQIPGDLSKIIKSAVESS